MKNFGSLSGLILIGAIGVFLYRFFFGSENSSKVGDPRNRKDLINYLVNQIVSAVNSFGTDEDQIFKAFKDADKQNLLDEVYLAFGYVNYDGLNVSNNAIDVVTDYIFGENQYDLHGVMMQELSGDEYNVIKPYLDKIKRTY